jgi:outer membrane protein
VKFHPILIAALVALPVAAQTAAPAAAPAVAPSKAAAAPKVAVMLFQRAVLTTKEGQQASAALKARFDPRKADIAKRQAALEALQDKLQKGAATMTPEARDKMQEDLTRSERQLKRDVDDLNTDLQDEEGRIMQDMAQKMSDIIQKYATRNGFSVVLDVSSQQTPVLWAAAETNITADIVKEYDEAHPVKTAAVK